MHDTGHWDTLIENINESEWSGFIYIIINKINGRRYIGKRYFTKNWKKYISSSKSLKQDILLFGKESFDFIILELCCNKEHLSIREIELLELNDVLFASYENQKVFYNENIGGKLFFTNFGVSVKIDNITYNTLTEAQSKFNISFKELEKRCFSSSWPTWAFNSERSKRYKKYFQRRDNKIIVCENIEYLSIAEAARILNISIYVIETRLRSIKWENWFYKEDNIKLEKIPPKIRCNLKKVQIDNICFPSVISAAKYFVTSVDNIRSRCNSMEDPAAGYIENGEFIKPNRKFTRNICVSIDGIFYGSLSKASKKLNLSQESIRERCDSATYTNYLYYRNEKFYKPEDTQPNYNKSMIRISINEIIFDSLSNATENTGLSSKVIKKRIQSTNYPEYFYVDEFGQKSDKLIRELHKILKGREVIINDITYKSISDASRCLSITETTIKNRCNSVNFQNWVFT